MDGGALSSVLLPGLLGIGLIVALYFILGGQNKKRQQRIARVTRGRAEAKQADPLSLRRKAQESSVPFATKILSRLSSQTALKARIERAGLSFASETYLLVCAGAALLLGGMILLLGRSPILALLVALVFGLALPHFYLKYRGAKRVKRFLTLFPDAIDYIVRGLRSGLPVTESMNQVGAEMEEPVGSIFAGIGESVRLGVSLEKALQDTALKLDSTEFNFFVTSLILQRETGGNLSEILSNLAVVLRKRFMMRMKIKAMSSEAKASAIIVGSLPFIVIAALLFVSPGYLDPLINDRRGNLAAVGALFSLALGIGIMIKMAKFEI